MLVSYGIYRNLKNSTFQILVHFEPQYDINMEPLKTPNINQRLQIKLSEWKPKLLQRPTCYWLDTAWTKLMLSTIKIMLHPNRNHIGTIRSDTLIRFGIWIFPELFGRKDNKIKGPGYIRNSTILKVSGYSNNSWSIH